MEDYKELLYIMKINLTSWLLKKQQLKSITVNAAAMSGKNAAKDLCLYRVLNAKVRYGMKKRKNKKRIIVIGALRVPSKSPKRSPIRRVITMYNYTFLPDIFYPTFDSLTTSLFSQVIA
jgi:hypothetical protein